MPNYAGLWSSKRFGQYNKIEIWTRDRRSDSVENFIKHTGASLERKLAESSERQGLELLAVFEYRDGQWVLVHKTDKVSLGEFENEHTSTEASELRSLYAPELHEITPRVRRRYPTT